MIGDKTIAILTVRKQTLSEECFSSIKRPFNAVVYGMEGTHFSDIYVDNHTDLDIDEARDDIFKVIDKLLGENTNIGAILFECTNMAPFSQDVINKYQLPVFDICSLVRMMNNVI